MNTTAGKRSQRAIPLAGRRCARCGTPENLQRHHPDIRHRPGWVLVVCQRHHTDIHLRRGDWPNRWKNRIPGATFRAEAR